MKNPKGLTKREYFAAMAIQGLLSSITQQQSLVDVPQLARVLADALIKELGN